MRDSPVVAHAGRPGNLEKRLAGTPNPKWEAKRLALAAEIQELDAALEAASRGADAPVRTSASPEALAVPAEDLAQRVGELERKLQQVIADGEDRVAAKDEEIAKLQHTIVECDSLLGDNQDGLCASETQGKSLCQRIQRLKALHADEVHVLQLRMHTEEA